MYMDKVICPFRSINLHLVSTVYKLFQVVRFELSTHSSMGPSYFGLLTNMTLRRSARHLMMCMKRSNGVEAGFVVYIT